ncbi:CapA family protein [Thermophilibacter sp.]
MPATIKVTFVGDVMCKGEMFPAYGSKDGGFDFSPLFVRVKSYLRESDLVVANLETPISGGEGSLTSERYSFCSPHAFAEAVRDCGITAVSTANNHCLDRGIDGIVSTVESLDKAGVLHTGVFADLSRRTPLIVTVGGMRIGLMSYTYGTNAFLNNCYLPKSESWRVNLFQEQELSHPFTRFRYKRGGLLPLKVLNKVISLFSENSRCPVYERSERSRERMAMLSADIERMRVESPDLVVMCMHAGGQYNPEATADTKALATWLLENGVDIVAGTHEHVVHGGDFNRQDGRVAAYCLGNFDGIDGVYDAPFDKLAEYSIAWNLYLDPTQIGPEAISKMSFSVLKSIPLKGTECGIQVVPVADLYTYERDSVARDRLLEDVKTVARRFCGRDVVNGAIEKEYLI